jgi:endoglucanase
MEAEARSAILKGRMLAVRAMTLARPPKEASMRFLSGIAAAPLLLAAAAAVLHAEPSSVPKARLDRLSRGVNVTQWFQAYGPTDDIHYKTYMSDGEIAMIRKLGLTHVRLCVSPQYLYDPATPDEPIEQHLAAYQSAIQRFLAHDLAVIVDPHNTDQKRLEGAADWAQGYPAFWGALAAKLKHFDPNKVFFEVVNEPVFDKHETDWSALQERIVAAIRKNAPAHTIIVTGPNWGGIDGLRKLPPLSDRNLVYSFHLYDPFTFTHQGATWSGPVPPHLKGVPYPSSPELVADVIARTDNEEAKNWIRDYGAKHWNRDRLKERLAEALAWGTEHDVPLYCGEFGVFPQNAPPESRKNWFRDFASVLKESGVGYAVWGWDDGFGFGRKLVDGKPVIDTVPVEALGLNMP